MFITGGVFTDHYFVILDFNLSILCFASFLVSSLNFFHSLTNILISSNSWVIGTYQTFLRQDLGIYRFSTENRLTLSFQDLIFRYIKLSNYII